MITKKHYIIATIIISMYLLVLTIIDQNLFSLYAVPTVIAASVFSYKFKLFTENPVDKPLSFIILKAMIILFISTIIGVLTVRVFFW